MYLLSESRWSNSNIVVLDTYDIRNFKLNYVNSVVEKRALFGATGYPIYKTISAPDRFREDQLKDR